MEDQTIQVYERVRDCIKIFDEIFHATPHEASSEDVIEIAHSMLSDELGRLRLWAGDCGAYHPASSELSLEYRLRGVPNLQVNVLEILEKLKGQLHGCLLEIINPSGGDDTSDDLDEVLSQVEVDTKSELEYICFAIHKTTTLLYRFLMLTRQPAPKGELTFYQLPQVQSEPTECDTRETYGRTSEQKYPESVMAGISSQGAYDSPLSHHPHQGMYSQVEYPMATSSPPLSSGGRHQSLDYHDTTFAAPLSSPSTSVPYISTPKPVTSYTHPIQITHGIPDYKHCFGNDSAPAPHNYKRPPGRTKRIVSITPPVAPEYTAWGFEFEENREEDRAESPRPVYASIPGARADSTSPSLWSYDSPEEEVTTEETKATEDNSEYIALLAAGAEARGFSSDYVLGHRVDTSGSSPPSTQPGSGGTNSWGNKLGRFFSTPLGSNAQPKQEQKKLGIENLDIGDIGDGEVDDYQPKEAKERGPDIVNKEMTVEGIQEFQESIKPFEVEGTSIGNLALTYENQGRFKEAAELWIQVMKAQKRVLGPEHLDTLKAIGNIASTYWNQGRLKEAEELDIQVMEVRTRILGPEHPDTLKAISNLASTYWNQGRLKEAEQLDIQVMEVRKRVLGPKHRNTLKAISKLASTYRNQGRLKEAEQLDIQVMGVRKRMFGPGHPDTLKAISNLASTYWNQGRLNEAEELDIQIMKVRKMILGPEHPNTLKAISNLASTYWNQGRLKEAEQLWIQVMKARKRVLGPEHLDTLKAIGNIASTYWNQGRLKEAEELDIQVMEVRMGILGPEHPDTLKAISNLASTYWNQGRLKEAEQLDIQVMEVRKRVLGPEHPDTLKAISNLAST